MGACYPCSHTCSCHKMPSIPLPSFGFAAALVLLILSLQSSLNVLAKEGMQMNAKPINHVSINHRKTASNVDVRNGITGSFNGAMRAAAFAALVEDSPASSTNFDGEPSSSSISNRTGSTNTGSITSNPNSNNNTDINGRTVKPNSKSDPNSNDYIDINNYSVCRCIPGSPCWPSLDAWDNLNRTLGGQLLRPNPPASPCYNGPNQNITACQIAAANWLNPFWRADQAGAMQYSNKEAQGNQSCSLFSSPLVRSFRTSTALGALNASLLNSSSLPTSSSSSPSSLQCQQGAVPVYAVEVLNASHVQATILFAAENNIRLSIKSSGHDALGRSTAAGSLNLWMHQMNKITFYDSFTPRGCDAGLTFPAVTAESGTQWGELYTAADAKNLVVVGAMSASVSTGGGFMQGGGHSPLSPFLGLAADNVIEMQVVTADGRLITANDCQNRDLFWALRGGGGGTFGVVVSSTYITYPPLLNVVNVHFIATFSNLTLFEDFLTRFIYLQSALSEDNFWAGYSYITASPEPSLTINYLVPNYNTSTATDSFRPLIDFTSQYPNDIVVNLTISAYPSFGTWHKEVLCKANPGVCTDPSGLNTVLASRLLPQNVLQEKAAQVAQAFLTILSSGVGTIVGHLVGGQGVAAGQNLAAQDRLKLLRQLRRISQLGAAKDVQSTPHDVTYSNGDITDMASNKGKRHDAGALSGQHDIAGISVAGQDKNKDSLSNQHVTFGHDLAGRGGLNQQDKGTSSGQRNNEARRDKDVPSGQDVESNKDEDERDALGGQDKHVSSSEDVKSDKDAVGLEKLGRDPLLGFAKDTLRQYAKVSRPTNAENATNSVNPAFRAALWHVVLLNVWGDEGEGEADSQTITVMNGLLRELSPGSGCYLNEADVNEPNWQDAFYGQHYNRLRQIKDRLDPEGLFTCTNCVGSESWTTDDQLLCRRPTM